MELLYESVSLYEQTYGILHPTVARFYLSIANIFYQMDEKAIAVELARKAVMVSERSIGLDSAETIQAYLNLGLFEHASGRTKLALRYVLHAIDLTKISYGPNHPDCVTILNNGAVMLQQLRRYHESRVWFEATLAISERLSGKGTLGSATILYQLAQAFALDRDHHTAVNKMRESSIIFRNLLGPDDSNTKEAESWLDQLTMSAVSQAKRQKDIDSGKIRRPHFPLSVRPLPNVGSADVGVSGRPRERAPSVDMRNIDDLIAYIDGDDSKTKKKGTNKKSNNPKRRGGSTVSGKA
jgi:protein TIF31